MRIRLSWIVLAVVLVLVAPILVPRLRVWAPSSSGAPEARPEQSTPQATVNTMFQTTDQGGESDSRHAMMTDRLYYADLLQGTDMTGEEKEFAALFWDNQRSAIISAILGHALTTSAHITASEVNGDSALVSVAARAIWGSRWVDYTCTVELKKRGPNWYVYELRSPQIPDGFYHGFQQRIGSTP
ncbi:MAG: hypothetical protein LAO56_04480 [Acidobacteriia bacterium]|nr:hypothetical protein [Terriglobia bacterium]